MSHKHGQRWEFVVGKALKDWATVIMHEGHTRAEARQMILEEIKKQSNPPGEISISIKKFLRVPFLRGWTIGWDLKNRAILQFTKTEPYTPGKYHCIGFFFVRYTYASLNIHSVEGRHWLNIGWNV
jgi:hypothetical protein